MTVLQRYLNRSQVRSVECPKYQPRAGSKRCQHYLDNGACALSTELMCVEWLKCNRHFVSQDHASPRTAQPAILPSVAPGEPDPPPPVPAHARAPIAQEEIDSFKALGVELRLDLDEAGPVWLVPRYTGQARKEITPEHAATLRLLLDAFPGARIAAFEKTALARGEEAQA
jgi:hypothetical protein